MSVQPDAARLLETSREEWNRWRSDSGYTPIRLCGLRAPGADLSGRDLRGCDLSGAVLPDADASALVAVRSIADGADFRNAVLSGAALAGASLRRAAFSDADLSGTDLTDTLLDGADLSGADLQGADLRGASVVRTKLRDAIFGWTMLANLDISDALGLRQVVHRSPSTLGLDVIQRAKNRLPVEFLRGVGVEEDLIRFLSAPLGRRLQIPSCFISYSFKDHEFATRLHNDLQRSGVRCWLAERSLATGEPIDATIATTISTYDVAIVILSRGALASAWVQTEVQYALRKEQTTANRVLLPITLDDAVMTTRRRWAAEIRNDRKIGNFSAWRETASYRAAFELLLHDLGINRRASRHPVWR